MSNARVAAHPLIVAMAFGLLGPAALADDEVDATAAPSTSLDEATTDASLAAAVPEAIDADDFARVEREWLAVRNLTF